MNKELNKKLAEWAANAYQDFSGGKHRHYFFKGEWYEGKGGSPDEPPFAQSLDASFRWLVPKLQDRGHNIELYSYEHKGYSATIYKEVFSQRGSDGYDPWLQPISQVKGDNPALALCLAIEKLIDDEKDKAAHKG